METIKLDSKTGELLYACFCKDAKGIDVITGKPLLPWVDLKPQTKAAWQMVAEDIFKASALST